MVALWITGNAPRLGGIVTVTIALPTPLSGSGLSVALFAPHAQAASDDETTMLAGPPAAPTVSLAGLMPNEQEEPNCVTVCVCPLTVNVRVRALAPTLGVTE
jgi:hypothetical protein